MPGSAVSSLPSCSGRLLSCDIVPQYVAGHLGSSKLMGGPQRVVCTVLLFPLSNCPLEGGGSRSSASGDVSLLWMTVGAWQMCKTCFSNSLSRGLSSCSKVPSRPLVLQAISMTLTDRLRSSSSVASIRPCFLLLGFCLEGEGDASLSPVSKSLDR